MKLSLLWGMEGVSSLFTREQVWFWEEAAAAKPGARRVDEVTVEWMAERHFDLVNGMASAGVD